MAALTKTRPRDHFKSGAQKHLLHSPPIVQKLVFVALPEIQIHNFHWGCCISTAPSDDLPRRIKIALQKEFRVRHDNSQTATKAENTMHLPRKPLAVFKRKVFHDMFAKDAIERLLWKR